MIWNFVDSVVYNMLKAMTYMDEKDLSTFHGEDTGKNFHCRFVWIEDLINTDDSIWTIVWGYIYMYMLVYRSSVIVDWMIQVTALLKAMRGRPTANYKSKLWLAINKDGLMNVKCKKIVWSTVFTAISKPFDLESECWYIDSSSYYKDESRVFA